MELYALVLQKDKTVFKVGGRGTGKGYWEGGWQVSKVCLEELIFEYIPAGTHESCKSSKSRYSPNKRVLLQSRPIRMDDY